MFVEYKVRAYFDIDKFISERKIYIFQPKRPLKQLAYSESITKTVGSFLGFGGQ